MMNNRHSNERRGQEVTVEVNTKCLGNILRMFLKIQLIRP